CRLTRISRDIPGTDLIDGNRMTNFRQVVEDELARRGLRSRDIRAREVRHRRVDPAQLFLDVQWYETACSTEAFLQFIDAERTIGGFLRLSLPAAPPLADGLGGAALIREVHVYGRSEDHTSGLQSRAKLVCR